MQRELVAYLSPSVSSGAGGSFGDEVKSQEIILRFMAAARSQDGTMRRFEDFLCVSET
jgi:hypothetical protein